MIDNSNVPGSIFIECLPVSVTEKQIRDIFLVSVGDVERVDFIPIDKNMVLMKTPMKKDLNQLLFISNMNMVSTLEFLPTAHQWNFIPEQGNDQYIWLLSPNRNRVPQTMMNTSQIVDNCRYLEDKICDQQYLINVQEDKIRKLETEMRRLQLLVADLIKSINY